MKHFLGSGLLALLGLLGLGATSVSRQAQLRPEQLASIRAAQPALVQTAARHLEGLRSTLGLGVQGGFQLRNAFTNTRGQVVARMNQTHDGVRVFGGEAIVHVLPGGEIRTQTGGVRPGITLGGQPALSPEQALAAARTRFGARGPLSHSRVEKVVFPTELTGGIAVGFDAEHRPQIDRALSVTHAAPRAAHVWAYEVTLGTRNAQDGVRELRYVVDGATGAILHVSNQVKSLTDYPLPGASTSQVTATGLYTGAVNLDASVDENGLSWLWDQTRGTAPLPFLRDIGASGYPGASTGLMMLYQDGLNFDPNWNDPYNFFSNAAGTFGDGAPYQGVPWDANGQTAAVDAQVAASKAWDLYQMFGRNGPDGLGTSVGVIVHEVNWQTGGPLEGAFFNNSYLILGDHADPAHPTDLMPYTEADVVGHEMSHGVVLSTAQLNGPFFGNESMGIAEAFCDAMGEATEALLYGTPLTDDFGTPRDPVRRERLGGGRPGDPRRPVP